MVEVVIGRCWCIKSFSVNPRYPTKCFLLCFLTLTFLYSFCPTLYLFYFYFFQIINLDYQPVFFALFLISSYFLEQGAMRLAFLFVLVGLMILARARMHEAVTMKTWLSTAKKESTNAALNRYNITSDEKRVVPTGPNPLHN